MKGGHTIHPPNEELLLPAGVEHTPFPNSAFSYLDYPCMPLYPIGTMPQEKFDCAAKKIYDFLHGLPPPIMNDIFKVRNSIYNLSNFQSLYSTS